MDRQLIDRLPFFLREYKEIKALMSAEQVEIEAVFDEVDRILDDQFIVSARGSGISRWEKIMGIVPRVSDSLEQRRLRVFNLINEKLPFTIRTLGERLKSICGQNNYEIRTDCDGYYLDVKIINVSNYVYFEVYNMLGRILPANLIFRVQLSSNLPLLNVNVYQSVKSIKRIIFNGEVYLKQKIN